MSISFEKLYNHFYDKICTEYYNKNLDMELVDAEILTDNCENYIKNCVYVGKTSMLKRKIDKMSNISIILIKDDDIEFKNYIDKNIKIIELNNNLNIFDIYDEVKAMFRRNSLCNQIKIKLLELVLADVGLEEIIKTASKLIGNPLIVIDLSFKVLVSSPFENISDTLWLDHVKRGYCSYGFIAELKKLKVIKEGNKINRPFEVTCPASPTKKVVSRIRVEGKIVGNILLLECQKKIESEDYIYLALISNIISKELSKKHFYRNTRNTIREEILYDLLENNLQNDEIIKERLNNASLKFNKYICIYVIDISKYKLKHSIYDRFLESHILNFFPLGYLIYYKGHITIINAKKEYSIKESKSNEIDKFLLENNLKMGKSNKFLSIRDCSIFYNQAIEALKIGNIIEPDRYFYQYKNIQPYIFIYRLKDRLKEEDLHNNALDLLKTYDDENKSELYKTLYIYLKNNHNITKTSEEMHVHRNTLRYRLEKITDILGFDIDENDNSFKLYYAIKSVDFYKKIINSNIKTRE